MFDQKTAILGEMNIGREYYSEWHDLMVRIEGPIAQSRPQEFNQTWKRAALVAISHFYMDPRFIGANCR